MHGEERVSGFTFGIVPAPMPDVVRENLRLHHHVFARLAAAFGVREGRAEAEAALKLSRTEQPSEEEYVAFLRAHRKPVAAAVASLQRQGREKDLVGIDGARAAFDRAVESGEARGAATAHLALLETIDVVQNMREIAKGNPLDIPPTVRWQQHLFSTVPQLTAHGASKDVVGQSEAFLEAYGSGKDAGRYGALLGSLQKPLRAVAAALRKEGVDVERELAALERVRKASPGAQQKAHRDFLLALHERLVRETPAQRAN
jgi:hypothetical protein